HVTPHRATPPGSVFSLEHLLDDLLVENQVRNRLHEPAVLLLKLLQTLDLVVPHPTELLPPPTQRLLADPQLLADLTDRLALTLQRLRLTKPSESPRPYCAASASSRASWGPSTPRKLPLRLDQDFKGRSARL